MIKAGERVTIKPQWQDAGDESITFLAIENEDDGGRVKIQAQLGLPINPVQVVKVEWLYSQDDCSCGARTYAQCPVHPR